MFGMHKALFAALIALSITARLLYADWYPLGFSGHAIAHAELRKRIYDLLFHSPTGIPMLSGALDLAVQEHHGPQSLLEALLTPLFGIGFDESRRLVSTLGVVSIVPWALALRLRHKPIPSRVRCCGAPCRRPL